MEVVYKLERKLASIQVIDDLWEIPGADLLLGARIEGWNCVVLKSEFSRIGEKCVYFEIDSVLPKADWTEFLHNDYRIKTKKFRGQISQGVAKPLDKLPLPKNREYHVGDDVTDLLGVTKWEPPASFQQGAYKGDFPSIYGIRKTDEMRIQSVLPVLEELSGNPYYISQKMDGTSFTAYIDPKTNEFEVCSRNMRIKKDSNSVYWKFALSEDIENKLRKYPSVCIQGELCGEDIQGNKIGIHGLDLYVFNAYDLCSCKYYDYNGLIRSVQDLGLKTVPILEEGSCFKYTLDELQNIADNGRYNNGRYQEGIVVRSSNNQWSSTLGGLLSFKVLNRNFLLKYDE